MSHTEGKLTLSKSGVIRAGEFHQYTNGKAQSQFAMVLCPDEWQAEEGVTQEENARRLVACWNACDGIKTESIEGNDDIHQPMLTLAKANQLLRDEHDELRKALKECQLALEPYDDVKPRDWKTDREKLAAAHQVVRSILARYQEGGHEQDQGINANRAAA